MKLLTKAVIANLKKHPIGSTDNKLTKNVVVKYFVGPATWLVCEGREMENGDWEFFGTADLGFGPEWGYFRLSQLQELRGPFGLSVERDRNYTGTLSI